MEAGLLEMFRKQPMALRDPKWHMGVLTVGDGVELRLQAPPVHQRYYPLALEFPAPYSQLKKPLLRCKGRPGRQERRARPHGEVHRLHMKWLRPTPDVDAGR